MSLGPIAVDSGENLDVAGFNGWTVWRVANEGASAYPGLPWGERRPLP
jgi:hypothetical protein